MTRLRMIGLCLVAAMAVSAVAVATASAEAPEFGRCVKKAKAEGSGYSDAGCTTAVSSGAKYEWLSGPGAKSHFNSVSRFVLTNKDKTCLKWKQLLEEGKTEEAAALLAEHGWTAAQCEETLAMHGGRGEDQEPVTLETVSGSTIECEELSANGEYSGAKTVSHLVVTFIGCNTVGNIPCQSPGAKTGEIVTSSLEGALGIIKKESVPVNNSVGIALFAESGNIAEIECSIIKITVTGSVIHQVTANKMLSKENEKFKQKKGFQIPENFDGEPQGTCSNPPSTGARLNSLERRC